MILTFTIATVDNNKVASTRNIFTKSALSHIHNGQNTRDICTKPRLSSGHEVTVYTTESNTSDIFTIYVHDTMAASFSHG